MTINDTYNLINAFLNDKNTVIVKYAECFIDDKKWTLEYYTKYALSAHNQTIDIDHYEKNNNKSHSFIDINTIGHGPSKTNILTSFKTESVKFQRMILDALDTRFEQIIAQHPVLRAVYVAACMNPNNIVCDNKTQTYRLSFGRSVCEVTGIRNANGHTGEIETVINMQRKSCLVPPKQLDLILEQFYGAPGMPMLPFKNQNVR